MQTNDLFSKSLLKTRNLKITATRLAVLTAIRAYRAAMPYSQLQAALADTDRITLYRTLNMLLENGLIHKAYITHEDTFYALCGDKCTTRYHHHNHIHFQCTTCKAVTCEYLAQDIAISLPAFTIEAINIIATGVCKDCNLLA